MEVAEIVKYSKENRYLYSLAHRGFLYNKPKCIVTHS